MPTKPHDKFNHYGLPKFEYACMTFAATKRMNVARTALHQSENNNTLLVERFDRKWSQERTWRLSPMYDVLLVLGEGTAQGLSMDVGIKRTLLSRANLLGQHQHFALAEDEAAAMSEEVSSWQSELMEHSSMHLAGAELDAAADATGSKRLLEPHTLYVTGAAAPVPARTW